MFVKQIRQMEIWTLWDLRSKMHVDFITNNVHIITQYIITQYSITQYIIIWKLYHLKDVPI